MAECRRILALFPASLENQARLVENAFNASGSTEEADRWIPGIIRLEREHYNVQLAIKWRALITGDFKEWQRLDSADPGNVIDGAIVVAADGDMARQSSSSWNLNRLTSRPGPRRPATRARPPHVPGVFTMSWPISMSRTVPGTASVLKGQDPPAAVDPDFAPLRGDPRFEALLKDPKNHAPLFYP